MDQRRHWQSQSNGYYQPSQASGMAVDPLQDAQGLLSMYPMASATPTTHVTRHLSNLSLTAAPPSYYVQPVMHHMNLPIYPQSYPQQYSDYSNEINLLNSSSQSSHGSGFFDNSRANAIRYLDDRGSGYLQYEPSHLWPMQSSSSTYQTNAFAQSVFQHVAPSSSYPTPPPPPGISISSSSIAAALGTPPKPKTTRTVYQPSESTTFFNEFLAQQTAKPRRTDTPPSQPQRMDRDSPDPIGISPVAVRTSTVTPRKRKAPSILDSPSVKRIHTPNGAATPPIPSTLRDVQTTPTSKRKAQVYVELPPVNKLNLNSQSHPLSRATPRNTVDSDSDDLGGYGSEGSPSKKTHTPNHVKSHSRRATGDRDDRAPLEKLSTLLEDIFEAEDSLAPDMAVQDLPTDFFSPHTSDCSQPLLSFSMMRKLLGYLAKVARPNKRLRFSARDQISGVTATPKSRGRITDIDSADLSRTLRVLERSVKFAEELDPFNTNSAFHDGETKPSSSKSTKKKADQKRSKSTTPKPSDTDGDVDVQMGDAASDGDAIDFDTVSVSLEIAKEGVLAAECCIALLASDRLPKQLYSEELISSCLSTIKNQLSRVIYPFVEASADIFGNTPPILQHLVRAPSSEHDSHRRQVTEIFNTISSAIPRINDLISSDYMAMSESIIIQAVYIAIGPFFMGEAGGSGKEKSNVVLSTLGSSAAIRGLRLDALSLIRSIFANHEDQRSWIIEEILSSLIKHSESKQRIGQFRLRDGRTIRTVSALLLQLVQTSAHGVRLEAQDFRKARLQAAALRRENSSKNIGGPFLDETDMEEIRLYMSGIESATKAAKTIILFLTQRSGKTKITKNSNEAEYRAIFDNLISDLLTVLFWPEWPAASLLLSIACKFMVASLDDIKTAPQNDNNAAKTIALDHLGVIAARIRACMLKTTHPSESRKLLPLDEISTSLDISNLEALSSAHKSISSFLSKRSSEDQACASARELAGVVWGQELAFSLKQCGGLLEEDDGEKPSAGLDRQQLLTFGNKLKDTFRGLWQEDSGDVFDVGSQDDISQADRLAEQVGITQSLRGCFNPILNVVLLALDAPPVFMRTKALKALGQIITSDPTILSMHNVRNAIEGHLLDSSPAVRDAAVELIGKYMIDSPEVAADYYPKIAERIADTGLSVRKRVIKLLKSFYAVTKDTPSRIDICNKLVLRMLDEDDAVKDLAIKTLEELWFAEDSSSQVSKGKGSSHNQDKSEHLARVSVIMGVASSFKDRQSPVEELLHHIIDGKDANETSRLHARYAEVCETLIDGLVDASDLPGFTVLNCVRTIYFFAAAHPAVLTPSNVTTLLPYLKNPTTSEEHVMTDYLLRIFRACIPHLPKTAVKFGQELQLALQPMILKPNQQAGIAALQETVACMCAIVQHLTHDYVRLTALLKSCNVRLRQILVKPSQKLEAPEMRAMVILVSIASLLCQNCNFDQLRVTQESVRSEIDSINSGPIIEHIYTLFLRLYEKYNEKTIRSRLLQCMGFLFRAQPTLLTAEASTSIMDSILVSSDDDSRARLLRIIQDFLSSEAEKHSQLEKERNKSQSANDSVNMEELIGNTDGFADSGVSSAVVQRYLNPILASALSPNSAIQTPAVDIVGFTVKQGLAHPLQLFPVIVALETSPSNILSARATALHTILHSKHTSLLNSRFVVSARASFDYQLTISPNVQGYRMTPAPMALLQRWYSLVREKRTQRQDFLKALVKVFDVELNKTTESDVNFARYMAENFATFEYKTQEEVLTVIKYLTAVLSTSGAQLAEVFSPSPLAQLRDVSAEEGQTTEYATAFNALDDDTKMTYARSSIVVAVIMILKAYLKTLYGLSEDKCSKFVLGKKSAVGDRPAARRHEKPISWERVPFATTRLQSPQDLLVQHQTFLTIWHEDGLTTEPTDD
ncbi:ARM repeat-containing protein [Panus rudis PR-1116 ss-1]|nr:ARM repeat-containing protein [Panus rudis PR-1116 ss-1]